MCAADCPEDMENIGISCKKFSYERAKGEDLICDADHVKEKNGRCFEPCPLGSHGIGPVCWGQCPIGTNPCGDLLCLSPDKSCGDYIAKDILDIVKSVGDITTQAIGGQFGLG